MSTVTEEMVKRAASEYLSHKGDNPWRVLRRGAELWEDHAPAIRAALQAALLSTPNPGDADGWRAIEEIDVKEGERFYAAEPDGDGWVVGVATWCKTPHVPLYGFHFTEGDPENWSMCKPTLWQPLPAPPAFSLREGEGR